MGTGAFDAASGSWHNLHPSFQRFSCVGDQRVVEGNDRKSLSGRWGDKEAEKQVCHKRAGSLYRTGGYHRDREYCGSCHSTDSRRARGHFLDVGFSGDRNGYSLRGDMAWNQIPI